MSAVVFVVLAGLLDPSAFGLVALASVFVALMQLFVDQGFGQALVQREKLEPAHIDSAFWASLAVGLGLTAVGFVSADLVSAALDEDRLAPVLRALSFSLLLGGLTGVPDALLTRNLQFRTLAVRKLVATACGGIVGVACAVGGLGVWSLVAQVLVQGTVGTIVVWTCVPWRPGLRFSLRHFRELFGFGVNVMAVTLMNFLNRRADDLLIGAVLGTRALGIYSIAYRLLLLLTEVMTKTIDTVAFPLFSQLQSDPERMRRGYLRAVQISTTIATPVFLMMAVLAPEIINVFFGSKWEAAVPVMQILSFIGILHASLFFNSTVLMAAGHPRRVVFLTALNAFSNVIAFAFAVRWGIAAVAAAYVIRGYVLSPLPIFMVHRVMRFPVRDFLGRIAVPFFAGGVMAGIVSLASELLVALPAPPRLCVLALVGAVVYPVVLRLVAPRSARELWAYMQKGIPFLRRVSFRAALPWRWRTGDANG